MKNYYTKTVKTMFENGVDFKNIVREVKLLFDINDQNEIEKIIDIRNKLINKKNTHKLIVENLIYTFSNSIFDVVDDSEYFNLNCLKAIANRAGAFYLTDLDIVLVKDNEVSINGNKYHRKTNDPIVEIIYFYDFCIYFNEEFKL